MKNLLDIKECLGELITDRKYRKAFYDEYGYNESALDDESESIRLNYYRSLGFTEKAFDDVSKVVRQEAYRTLGFKSKAFTDTDAMIRKEAYDELGYSEIALNDQHESIRESAAKYLAKLLPVGDKLRYALFIDERGYYAKNQPNYEWSYTDDISKAKLYKTAQKAINLATDNGKAGKIVPVGVHKVIKAITI